jgi:C-terminal of Roc, COR, domain
MVRSANYPRGKWLFLLRLMSLFQLAYPLDLDGSRLLVPALLPLEPPSDSEEPADPKAERLRYEFDVVPGQLISRFLVRSFSLIDGNRLWRRGGVPRYDQARGRIWSTQDERWIYATVAGPAEDQGALLEMARGTLSDLFNEYKHPGVVEYRKFGGNWVPARNAGAVRVGEDRACPAGTTVKRYSSVAASARLFLSYEHQNSACLRGSVRC